jgi:hypothetical protein
MEIQTEGQGRTPDHFVGHDAYGHQDHGGRGEDHHHGQGGPNGGSRGGGAQGHPRALQIQHLHKTPAGGQGGDVGDEEIHEHQADHSVQSRPVSQGPDGVIEPQAIGKKIEKSCPSSYCSSEEVRLRPRKGSARTRNRSRQNWSQWAVRDGGWSDAIRWTSGDFNGDGRTDIGAIWNNNGTNVLTVRLSTGTTFTAQHWLRNAGGWMDDTVWLAGDFNGDGRSDLAGVWNDGGRTSIAVYLSDGTSFPGWSQWSVRDGGWSNTVKWVAGDFNGDERTDIGAAWNNNGVTTLTVRLSQGDSFNPVHWSEDAGHWWNASIFVPGDFDGDGRDDIAQIWNDVGHTSIKVSRSTGTSFRPPVDGSGRDGGWGGDIRWIPGDFNGDGRTDIAAAWNNRGTNTLTVRLSNGMRFTPEHWATDAGGWMESSAWCSGTFM